MSIQGTEANFAGRLFEDNLAAIFKARGVLVRTYAEGRGREDMFVQYIAERQVPYIGLHGNTCRADFVFLDQQLRRSIHIESKWQDDNGSVDKKLTHVFYDARDAIKADEVWIFLGGNGFPIHTVNWLKRMVAQEQGKTIRVLSPNDAPRMIKMATQSRAA